MSTDYRKQATDFCEKFGVKIEAVFLYHGPHFDDDKTFRDIYSVTIKREGKIPWNFKFGQSLVLSSDPEIGRKKEYEQIQKARAIFDSWDEEKKVKLRPLMHDLLKKSLPGYSNYKRDAFLDRFRGVPPDAYTVLACMTKYEPGSFENFCADYGGSTDSIRSNKLYLAVQAEWEACRRMFSDCMEELREIQ